MYTHATQQALASSRAAAAHNLALVSVKKLARTLGRPAAHAAHPGRRGRRQRRQQALERVVHTSRRRSRPRLGSARLQRCTRQLSSWGVPVRAAACFHSASVLYRSPSLSRLPRGWPRMRRVSVCGRARRAGRRAAPRPETRRARPPGAAPDLARPRRASRPRAPGRAARCLRARRPRRPPGRRPARRAPRACSQTLAPAGAQDGLRQVFLHLIIP